MPEDEATAVAWGSALSTTGRLASSSRCWAWAGSPSSWSRTRHGAAAGVGRGGGCSRRPPTPTCPCGSRELTATRAAALDAHATELRRIERSLHDGTQNRLVAVTVLLGAARRASARDPAGAEAILERAQNAAEQALAELRTVARGILPPVLADRGLAGALAGLAATCPVPCRIDVEVPGRCAASVEATAYFVVAEALTNVAKHSGARHVDRHGPPPRRPAASAGRPTTAGAARTRAAGPGSAASAAGSRRTTGPSTLTSPPGGPTTLEVESAMRIVIAEDDPLLREGLALLLRAESLDVVATAGNPDDFLTAVDAHRPDVAIVDVRMPPTHTDEGIVAAVEARRRQPDLAVLVLSAYVEQAFATELLAGGASRPRATCSRSGSAGSRSSWTRCTGWRTAAPRSTPRSSRSCSPAPAPTPAWTGSAPGNGTCSR